MAVLPTQAVSRTGLGPTYSAAAGGGDKLTPGDHVCLHVKNGGGSSITVTLVTPGTVEGLAVADVAVVVPNAGERMIGPLPASLFRASDGYADVTYSGVTSVTVAVLSV